MDCPLCGNRMSQEGPGVVTAGGAMVLATMKCECGRLEQRGISKPEFVTTTDGRELALSDTTYIELERQPEFVD